MRDWHQNGDLRGRRILVLSLLLLTLELLVDPSDKLFHAKVPCFILVMLVWLFRLCTRRVSAGELPIWIGVILSGFAIPLFATAIGLLNGTTGTEAPTFATLKSFAILLLIPVVVNDRIDLLKIIIDFSILVALATIGVAAVSVVSPIAFDVIYNFTIEKQNAMIATSQSHFGLQLGSFYYKTAAVLLIPLSFYCHRTILGPKRFSSFVLMLLFGAALFLSGTRANVLLALGIVVFLIILHVAKTANRRLVASITLLLIFIVAAPFASSLFDPKETSNEVKIEHYRSYITEFSDHPTFLLWGEGADTFFYTSGFQQKVNITELSYMEMLRIFGIPVTVALLIGLAAPAIFLWKMGSSERYVVVGYVAYLLGAASNPLLISSTGLLIVVAVWQRKLVSRDEIIKATYAMLPPEFGTSHQPGT